uniref:RNase H type-1 domain-containing protein n=1 Tax=Aegilops tauschii subsp. strangulata TaxID=200361 RepID=A0A452Y2Q0_AEGTS
DSGSGSTGAILRDDMRIFMAASCGDIPFVEDAATAEARALRDGLLLANDLGCNKLYVEADCMEVIEVMQSGGNSLGPAAAIYEECSFLARNFSFIVFNHCPREANMAADVLARNS